MIPLFQLETLNISLRSEFKNLTIEFKNQFISRQTISDLHEVSKWLSQHIEIHSVTLTSLQDSFLRAWDQQEWLSLKIDEIHDALNDLRELSFSFIQLPQTVVADLKRGSNGAGLEFALCADIRIMHEEGSLVFDHLRKGMTPASGGCGLLAALMGKALAKTWVQSTLPVASISLTASGFIQSTYTEKNPTIDLILKNISHQAPVARIQAKHAFSSLLFDDMKITHKTESAFALSSYTTEDYVKFHTGEGFVSAKEWGESLRNLSLVGEKAL